MNTKQQLSSIVFSSRINQKAIAYILLSSLTLFLGFITMAFAQSAEAQAASFVATFNEVILFPTIALLSAVAFLVFLWGTAEYLFNAANDQARQQGVKHITFGIIGLVVMVSAFAILSLAAATFGLEQNLDCADDPSAAGCEAFFAPANGGGQTGGNTGGQTGGNSGGQTGGNPGYDI